jgi:hypothetical protein
MKNQGVTASRAITLSFDARSMTASPIIEASLSYLNRLSTPNDEPNSRVDPNSRDFLDRQNRGGHPIQFDHIPHQILSMYAVGAKPEDIRAAYRRNQSYQRPVCPVD